MLSSTFGAGPLSLLCLGAHSDDIEIGCGATIMRLLAERPGSTVDWVVFSAADRRAEEARASAAAFTHRAMRRRIEIHAFAETRFPETFGALKDAFGALVRRVDPDVVFTHRCADRHQDHRTLGELTWNHFRDHLILEYEIPKYEGDLGHPNLYAPLDRELARMKVDLLLEHFASQRERPWFTREVFRGLLAVRGAECRAPSGFAEAFHVHKLVV